MAGAAAAIEASVRRKEREIGGEKEAQWMLLAEKAIAR